VKGLDYDLTLTDVTFCLFFFLVGLVVMFLHGSLQVLVVYKNHY
jgi:hypothetical protein